MPYANTGGGTRQSLTQAQGAALKRKQKAQKVGKSVPHMINVSLVQKGTRHFS